MNEATRTPRPASQAPRTEPAPPARPIPSGPPIAAARAGRRTAWRWPLLAVGAVLAVYLVGRGIAELILIHYGNPASYANDWGGPSLAGVLAVHSGPGLVIVAAGAWWWVRGRGARP
jgi:hypothetical protein